MLGRDRVIGVKMMVVMVMSVTHQRTIMMDSLLSRRQFRV